MFSPLKLKRILIKMSGEILIPDDNKNQEESSSINNFITSLKHILNHNIQIAIVVGGGNIIRGGIHSSRFNKIERTTADFMGMLSTIINALALSDILSSANLNNKILSAISIDGIVKKNNYKSAILALQTQKIVIFSGGTGNPFLTTDSTATLRSIEIKADAIFKMTKVNGVYNKDPNKYKDAKKFDYLTFDEALNKELSIMDLQSLIQARDFNIPIYVLNFTSPNTIPRMFEGYNDGTWIYN